MNDLLPDGLESTGTGWVMIGEMVKTTDADPDAAWRDPGLTNYNECVVGLDVAFGHKKGRYSALVWVDRDWSLGMGQVFGWPKRLGDIDVTRFNGAHPSLPEFGPGAKMGGTVSRHGRRIVEAAVHVPKDASVITSGLPGYGDTTFLHRFLPASGPDLTRVDELTELSFENIRTDQVYAGEGRLRFFESPEEELVSLTPFEVEDSYIYRRGWTTDVTAVLAGDLHVTSTAGRRHP